jgi:hypothetical protein
VTALAIALPQMTPCCSRVSRHVAALWSAKWMLHMWWRSVCVHLLRPGALHADSRADRSNRRDTAVCLSGILPPARLSGRFIRSGVRSIRRMISLSSQGRSRSPGDDPCSMIFVNSHLVSRQCTKGMTFLLDYHGGHYGCVHYCVSGAIGGD